MPFTQNNSITFVELGCIFLNVKLVLTSKTIFVNQILQNIRSMIEVLASFSLIRIVAVIY